MEDVYKRQAWLSDYSNHLMVEGNANLVRWMHVTPWKQMFPPDNPIVVLYNNADEDAVAALADRLEADPNVKSAMAYSCLLYTSQRSRARG